MREQYVDEIIKMLRKCDLNVLDLIFTILCKTLNHREYTL